jgi:DNA-binding NtrC family response regulator
MEDIVHLAEHLLQEICRKEGRAAVGLSEGAMRALRSHSWPGNVRELRNVLGSCVALAEGKVIVAGDLPPVFRPGRGTGPGSGDDLDRLLAALRYTEGDKSAAARRLGWSRMRVYRMLKRAGLPLDFGRPGAGEDAEGY